MENSVQYFPIYNPLRRKCFPIPQQKNKMKNKFPTINKPKLFDYP